MTYHQEDRLSDRCAGDNRERTRFDKSRSTCVGKGTNRYLPCSVQSSGGVLSEIVSNKYRKHKNRYNDAFDESIEARTRDIFSSGYKTSIDRREENRNSTRSDDDSSSNQAISLRMRIKRKMMQLGKKSIEKKTNTSKSERAKSKYKILPEHWIPRVKTKHSGRVRYIFDRENSPNNGVNCVGDVHEYGKGFDSVTHLSKTNPLSRTMDQALCNLRKYKFRRRHSYLEPCEESRSHRKLDISHSRKNRRRLKNNNSSDSDSAKFLRLSQLRSITPDDSERVHSHISIEFADAAPTAEPEQNDQILNKAIETNAEVTPNAELEPLPNLDDAQLNLKSSKLEPIMDNSLRKSNEFVVQNYAAQNVKSAIDEVELANPEEAETDLNSSTIESIAVKKVSRGKKKKKYASKKMRKKRRKKPKRKKMDRSRKSRRRRRVVPSKRRKGKLASKRRLKKYKKRNRKLKKKLKRIGKKRAKNRKKNKKGFQKKNTKYKTKTKCQDNGCVCTCSKEPQNSNSNNQENVQYCVKCNRQSKPDSFTYKCLSFFLENVEIKKIFKTCFLYLILIYNFGATLSKCSPVLFGLYNFQRKAKESIEDHNIVSNNQTHNATTREIQPMPFDIACWKYERYSRARYLWNRRYENSPSGRQIFGKVSRRQILHTIDDYHKYKVRIFPEKEQSNNACVDEGRRIFSKDSNMNFLRSIMQPESGFNLTNTTNIIASKSENKAILRSNSTRKMGKHPSPKIKHSPVVKSKTENKKCNNSENKKPKHKSENRKHKIFKSNSNRSQVPASPQRRRRRKRSISVKAKQLTLFFAITTSEIDDIVMPFRVSNAMHRVLSYAYKAYLMMRTLKMTEFAREETGRLKNGGIVGPWKQRALKPIMEPYCNMRKFLDMFMENETNIDETHRSKMDTGTNTSDMNRAFQHFEKIYASKFSGSQKQEHPIQKMLRFLSNQHDRRVFAIENNIDGRVLLNENKVYFVHGIPCMKMRIIAPTFKDIQMGFSMLEMNMPRLFASIVVVDRAPSQILPDNGIRLPTKTNFTKIEWYQSKINEHPFNCFMRYFSLNKSRHREWRPHPEDGNEHYRDPYIFSRASNAITETLCREQARQNLRTIMD